MHAAPSVTYPVGRSAFAGVLAAVLAGLGALAVAAWTWQAARFGWRHGLAWAAVAACGALALAGWWRSPVGELRWDGAGWSWDGGGEVATGSPRIAIDLQSRLLLRWQPESGRVRWLWLERASDAAHWDALRRAVYSRASAPIPAFPPQGQATPPSGEPPTARQ